MTTFKISKGRHYSRPFVFELFIKTKTLKRKVSFYPDSIYSFGDTDDYDINKLFGRSFGFHHSFSCRFGWRPSKVNPDEIEILSYIHNDIDFDDNKPRYKKICNISLYTCYEFYLDFDTKRNQIVFRVNDNNGKLVSEVYEKFSMPKFRIGYFLKPYFGGNRKSPNDILITLNKF